MASLSTSEPSGQARFSAWRLENAALRAEVEPSGCGDSFGGEGVDRSMEWTEDGGMAPVRGSGGRIAALLL